MDFFDRQEHARRQTALLIWLFGAAVLAVLVLNYLLLSTVIQPFLKPLPDYSRKFPFFVTIFFLIGEVLMSPLEFLKWLWDARLACFITLGTLVSITLGCLYKMRQLSGGGPAVAELLGGRRVEPQPTDADEQKLRHVIEEMAIAAGTPVPEIYLLENERGINAFAAGHTRHDVAVGVTRGCLKLLSRDELQGIIAHEFSHILNGDTRLNMRLMGLAHGLFWPTILGRVLLYGTTQPIPCDESMFDEEESVIRVPFIPIAVLFTIMGSVGLPFVRLIKSAICRQREWLADAAAVQFTRNPQGIVGAFKKIGGLFKHGRLDTPHAETASHLYFVHSAYDPWFSFQSTHPPLVKRILAIDPTFDGKFPRIRALLPNRFERDQSYEKALANVMAVEGKCPDTFIAHGGNFTAEHIRQAAAMRLGLPQEVMTALREPPGAMSVIYALLLSQDDSLRARQLQILQTEVSAALLQKTQALGTQIRTLGGNCRFALAEFALPALRQLDLIQYSDFLQTMQRLIECDNAVELFEYALLKMVSRRLRSHFEGPDYGRMRFGSVKMFLPECALLLSALAHVGQDNEEQTRKAFGAGVEFLDAPGASIQFLSRSEWDLSQVDAALTRLAKCPPGVQRNVLLACGKAVASDGVVTEREAALLRAIADSLDCPVPPFVDAMRMEELTAES